MPKLQKRHIIHSNDVCQPTRTGSNFSQGIEIPCGNGRLIFFSGITPRDKDCNFVCEGDIAGQTRQVCENLKAMLTAASAKIEDVVKLTLYVRDVKQHYSHIHAVRQEYWPTDPPASTMVQVQSLVDPRFLIDIDAIAWCPD